MVSRALPLPQEGVTPNCPGRVGLLPGQHTLVPAIPLRAHRNACMQAPGGCSGTAGNDQDVPQATGGSGAHSVKEDEGRTVSMTAQE